MATGYISSAFGSASTASGDYSTANGAFILANVDGCPFRILDSDISVMERLCQVNIFFNQGAKHKSCQFNGLCQVNIFCNHGAKHKSCQFNEFLNFRPASVAHKLLNLTTPWRRRFIRRHGVRKFRCDANGILFLHG